MNLKGTRTEKNLHQAFTHELKAYFEYIFAAKAAAAAGSDLIADIFYQTAANEAEHAEHEFNFLGGVGDIRASTEAAIAHEKISVAFYKETAKVAEEEGFDEIARFFHRISEVEERHKISFDELLQTLDEEEKPKGRTVRHSALIMAQLMLPSQANPAGFVHGGELMKVMDNAAGVTAARHCNSNVVTAQVNEINFYHPVTVGSLVTIRTRITFVSRSSMEVQVELFTENLETEKRLKALTSYYTMVAVDNTGRPIESPQLTLYTEEEQRLFKEGMARY
jgi:acyl-CoA hydrolase/ferritin